MAVQARHAGGSAVSVAHPAGISVEALPVGSTGPRCGCVSRHVPAPFEDEAHHVIPVGQPFGGDPKGELVYLCPTAHSAVHAAIRLLLRARERNVAADLTHVSRYARRLADRAIEHLDKEAAP